MGVYDYYLPYPELVCPLCLEDANLWQAKVGPCKFYYFHQNNAQPMKDRYRKAGNTLEVVDIDVKLPDSFVISSHCENHHSLAAECFSEHGVWRKTLLIDAGGNSYRLPNGYALWSAGEDGRAVSKRKCTLDSLRIPSNIVAMGYSGDVVAAKTVHTSYKMPEGYRVYCGSGYWLTNLTAEAETIVDATRGGYWLLHTGEDRLEGPMGIKELKNSLASFGLSRIPDMSSASEVEAWLWQKGMHLWKKQGS